MASGEVREAAVRGFIHLLFNPLCHKVAEGHLPRLARGLWDPARGVRVAVSGAARERGSEAPIRLNKVRLQFSLLLSGCVGKIG